MALEKETKEKETKEKEKSRKKGCCSFESGDEGDEAPKTKKPADAPKKKPPPRQPPYCPTPPTPLSTPLAVWPLRETQSDLGLNMMVTCGLSVLHGHISMQERLGMQQVISRKLPSAPFPWCMLEGPILLLAGTAGARMLEHFCKNS